MKRAVCAAALCLLAGSVSAQITPGTPSAAPRVDFTEQAMANTISRNLQSRGYVANDPLIQATIDRYNERVVALRDQQAAPSGGHTWMSVLKSLQNVLPWPITVGAGTPMDLPGSPMQAGGGSFGGGGAGGSWTAPSCSDVKIELAADGALIIPSYSLKVGGAMAMPSQVYGTSRQLANSTQAVIRRIGHLDNIAVRPDKRDWLGVVGCTDDASFTNCTFAGVSYRNSAGVATSRGVVTYSIGKAGVLHQAWASDAGHPYEHKPCPETQGGGGIDYYGSNTDWASHIHTCTWYVPDYSLSASGYAINDKTSIPFAQIARWPVGSTAIPEWQRACLIDKNFLAKLTGEIWKKACAQPGYNGAACPASIPTSDVRDGGAQVNDLGDTPSNAPAADPNAPSTPDPPSSGGGNTFEDKCDFADTPSGCSDPGTAAPETSEWTGIFDPILNWLPDLPSITLPEMNTACPTWNINLTDYGGPSWQFLVNSHCQLVEKPMDGGGTVGSVLGNLMIAVFGIAAALIILRA